jgi:hypothetical protein
MLGNEGPRPRGSGRDAGPASRKHILNVAGAADGPVHRQEVFVQWANATSGYATSAKNFVKLSAAYWSMLLRLKAERATIWTSSAPGMGVILSQPQHARKDDGVQCRR